MQISIRRDTISSAAAQAAAGAAVEHGRKLGKAVVAAVVDAAGDLMVCVRADGAFSASISIAKDKAYTAAVFGVTTDRLCELVAAPEVLRNGIAQRPGVVLFGGGFPIQEGDRVIGAIGVSGGAEEDDRRCALAGIAALGLTPPE